VLKTQGKSFQEQISSEVAGGSRIKTQITCWGIIWTR